jgi:hypothetical protein
MLWIRHGVKLALFGLLCAWREVLILCQQYLNEAARDLTITHLGMCLTPSYRWCMVSPGASRGMPDSLHQRL